MPDQEFKRSITGAVAAAQPAGNGRRKLKVDTSDLSDETKRSLGLLQPLKDEAENRGGAAQKTGEGFKATRSEAREPGNELGKLAGVGGLGRAASGRFGAAVSVVSAALELLKAAYKAVQEGIKGGIDATVHDDAGAIEGSAKAGNKYAEARKKAMKAINTPESEAARNARGLQDKLKLQQDIPKAEEPAALANLAAYKNQMSPRAYDAAGAHIKSAFRGKESAAEEKAKFEAGSIERANDARNPAKDDAGLAKTIIKAIDEKIEMVKRHTKGLTGGEAPEYEGAFGKIKQAKEFAGHYAHNRRRRPVDVPENLNLQRAQAIAREKQDADVGDAGKESAAAAQTGATFQAADHSNQERHDALAKALADLSAENRKLAAKIKNMPIAHQ